MARWRATLLFLPLFSVLVLLHLYQSPYTKVEESFNVQAAHDILQYGVPMGSYRYLKFKALYDHMTFPGAVPRTFLGAMMLAAVVKPFTWLFDATDGFQQQMLGELPP